MDSHNRSQQRIDFTRGDQLAMLRAARLEPPPGHHVTSATMKHVLKTIDDYGRGRTCYATLETLATSAGYSSRRTIQRAVAALCDLSVIAVELRTSPSGIVCNHYTVIWTELDLLTKSSRSPTDGNCGPTEYPTDGTLGQTDGTLGQTDGTLGQTDGTLGQTDGTCVSQPRSAFKRITTATNREAKTWEAAAVKLESAGVTFASDFVAEAQTLGRSPDEIIAAVETFLANRASLQSPGSLFVWLRRGAWPSPDVRAPEEVLAARLKTQTIEAPLRLELARAARYKQLRAEGLGVAEIDSTLVSEGFAR